MRKLPTAEDDVDRDPVAAVIYAAKSTEDLRGSIGTQLADCRAAAEAEQRAVVAEYRDEAASAFRGDRGPGLRDALGHAERLAAAHGTSELWVQHPDRLARGDGLQAAHLIEYVLRSRKAGVQLRAVQHDDTFRDLIRAVLTGERNHEDSARKAVATQAGKRRRFDSGRAVGGPINDGYRLVPELDSDGSVRIERDGRVVHRRELDPARVPLIARIFDLVEQGHSFGEVSRRLNEAQETTRRGNRWTTRAVRQIVTNAVYAGRIVLHGETRDGAHPPLIDPARWDRIQQTQRRLDPAAVQRRKGGRRPAEEYLLRGLAFCSRCGERLYTRRFASGRHYLCRNVREATGLCDADRIQADLLEAAVIADLQGLVPRVAAWLEQKDAERARERERLTQLVVREQQKLSDLGDEAEALRATFRRHARASSDLTDLALSELRATERSIETQRAAVEGAQARAQEWAASATVDDALDYFNDVRATIAERLAKADGIEATRAALFELLDGVKVDSYPGGRYRARIRLSTDLRVSGAYGVESGETRPGIIRRVRAQHDHVKVALYPDAFEDGTWPDLVADALRRQPAESDTTPSCRSIPRARRSRRRRTPAP